MKTLKVRAITLISGLLILCSASFSSLQAQVVPSACLPDCPQSNFTPFGALPAIDLVVPGQPGCTLRVEYGYRHACNIWHDFYIYSVEAIGNCSQGLLSDPNAILQTANYLLLMSNPPVDNSGSTVGPPRPTDCNGENCVTNWRVSKRSCWRIIGNTLFFPCESTTCCLQSFRICRDYCDNITVEAGNAFGGPCTPSGENGCVPVCN